MLSGNFAEMTTSTPFRDLLHAANLRHGTYGFTSLPKEGVLRIFTPLKIRRLRPGLNPQTWVLKASTLPLDHRIYGIEIHEMWHHGQIHKIILFSTALCKEYLNVKSSSCIKEY